MTRRRVLLLAPLAGAAVVGAGMYGVLRRMEAGRFDPHDVPNPIMGREVPPFDLPGLPGHRGFSDADLRAAGRPVLVNFFASWCVPCVIEHAQLTALAQGGLPIWGVAYKDTTEATGRFLLRHGDPYARVADDAPGRVAIDWGVYGVPESYLVDTTGRVRWRQAGPITPEIARNELLPLVRRAA